MLNAAIDATKVGGYIVYSTCSVCALEDEWVVDYALKSRFVKVVDSGLEIGVPGITKYEDKRFNPNVKKARRVFPHIHNMDGFFLAKLKKLQDGPRNEADTENAIKIKEAQKAKKERKKERMEKRIEKKAERIKKQEAAENTIELEPVVKKPETLVKEAVSKPKGEKKVKAAKEEKASKEEKVSKESKKISKKTKKAIK